jgi:hypothetical protein
MDADEYQEMAAGNALLAELKAEDPTGGWWPRLLARFPDPDVRAALHAAYWIGHEDGESEAAMYGKEARLRELCDENMTDAVGGGRTDADTIWPSKILAILDEDP